MQTRVGMVVVIALGVHLSALTASADPVRVVSGSLSFDTGDPPSFSLLTSSGQRFVAEGFAHGWPAICFYQCSPEASIPMSSASEPIDGMFFQADGVSVFPVMQLVLSAPSITPSSDNGTANGPSVRYARPFTMSGHLAGYASPDFTGAPLFDMSLSGSGMATLALSVEGGLYSFASLDYVFQPAPVPEPGTLLLVSGGAALLWRRRGSSRASSRRHEREAD